jgi:DNA modification methylase
MVRPYYTEPGIEIYCGDCREILPELPKVDLVLTDPPYGMNWNSSQISCGPNSSKGHQKGDVSGLSKIKIKGDDKPFDPSFLLKFEKVIIFGFNHFPQYLTKGTVLVWIKRVDTAFGTFLSDAELAWTNWGHGVYCFKDISLQGESRTKSHPSQKPLPLIKWCIGKAGEPQTILDPFMGSGTTLRAAKDLNRTAIGIEIEEKYCEIAVQRLKQQVLDL